MALGAILYVWSRPEVPTIARIEPAAGPAESKRGDNTGWSTSYTSTAYKDGKHAYEEGNYARAEQLFQEVVNRDPQNDEAWLMLARSRLNKGDYPRAWDAYANCLKQRPDDPDIWHEIGITLMQLKMLDQAEKSVNKALMINDKEARFWITLGHIRVRKGLIESACQAYRQAISVDAKNTDARKLYIDWRCSALH